MLQVLNGKMEYQVNYPWRPHLPVFSNVDFPCGLSQSILGVRVPPTGTKQKRGHPKHSGAISRTRTCSKYVTLGLWLGLGLRVKF
jgi:hypothetical protein